ncbi:MAG: bifunctional methylenetetrahydrofolate dehydrogenase/methenyltetrahydrofolate cyclohydrolase [Alphaproteobacteria bacterium]|nr:bifunctional methylenetetrahydrofolate dehydrogenase/methenyltetrahydrofolate cyclohydrolase [Alphaproteobacteria bacterium]
MPANSSSARIIDGRAVAARVRAEVTAGVAALKASHGITPGLAVILVGDNPASHIYVKNKITACAQTGIASFEHFLPADATAEQVLALIAQLNKDPAVHGILLQLPLPKHLDPDMMIMAVNPAKDVDGLHPVNAGLLMYGKPGLAPCTPQGCMILIREVLPDIAGLTAVMIGSSILCGKPMGQMLLRAHATLIQCHSLTKDLPDLCRRGDIVVVATGKPGLVRGDWIKPGAVVIDIGITKMPGGTIAGDVAFDETVGHARAITPVPGGVGPMTIACLMKNTLQAATPAA